MKRGRTSHNWGHSHDPLHEVDYLRTFEVTPDVKSHREEFAWTPKRSILGSLIWMKSYIIYETWASLRGVEKRLLEQSIYTHNEFVEAKLKGEVS